MVKAMAAANANATIQKPGALRVLRKWGVKLESVIVPLRFSPANGRVHADPPEDSLRCSGGWG